MNTTSQPDWEYLGNLGDTQPLRFGGAFLYSDRTGVYAPELRVVEPEPVEDETYDEPAKWEVRTIVLDRCTYIDDILSDNPYHPECPAWFAGYLNRVADCNGMGVFPLRDMLCSPTARDRADAYLALYNYFGSDNFDAYPIFFTSIDDIANRFPEPLHGELFDYTGGVDAMKAVAQDPTRHKTIRRYAAFSQAAQRERLAGRIARAILWENKADKAYASLPAKLRW